jgi:hypothetical protein
MARAFEVLENVIEDAAPFSCYHRIIDAQGQVRYVLSVGRGVLTSRGRVEQVIGFFVDLTGVRRSETQREVDAALLEVAEKRSVVEQAKGIVMLGAGCDADQALAILRKAASDQDVKLDELSRRLVERASHPAPDQENMRISEALNLLSEPETSEPEPSDLEGVSPPR